MLPKLLRFALPASLTFAPVASIAGEIGVSNSYSHGFREGTGSTAIEFVTTSQVSETAEYGAFKIEAQQFNGDDALEALTGNDKKGNGNGNGGNEMPEFLDTSIAASWGTGTYNMTQTTNVNGTTNEDFSFGSTNFSHSVSVFAK